VAVAEDEVDDEVECDVEVECDDEDECEDETEEECEDETEEECEDEYETEDDEPPGEHLPVYLSTHVEPSGQQLFPHWRSRGHLGRMH
jgi:hypothetical protein